ncbi:MAG: class I SAM-dependent RNA methyltransferase [Alphaproteobacteria bacterium]|nr:MAG: class I SAM-dependent RNA methyltransferase [Alphaproteobacteria bacterium]
MTEHLAIASMGHRGDGIAEARDPAVYVPYTLPGETVEVEAVPGHPDRRRLPAVKLPSPERIAPVCPHFGTCGGCAVQHWSFASYRAWKRGLVIEALAQAGLNAPVGDLIDAHGEGRRRAVFHARSRGRDILEVGFAASRSHRIVDVDRCPVLSPALDGAIDAAWDLAETVKHKGKPLDIQVTATEVGLDVDLRGSGPLPPEAMSRLARAADAHRLARLTRHGELVGQRAVPVVRVGKAVVPLPPGAFLQATAEGEASLARLVCAHVAEARNIADLFCGIGPFALRLAERARVTAADSDAGAVAALGAAAKTTPGLKPVATERRDLYRRPFAEPELEPFDAVVFDPPRQGALAQAQKLARCDVPFVIAVSCNAATFARDVRVLVDGGYRLEAVTPVDQFRYTPHVEIVARLAR